MLDRVLCPVLVQRDDQLATLEGALLATHRGDSGLVLLAGEAGIGKTRLVSELVAAARRLGATVLSGSCSEAELALPYLPFVEALGNRLGVRADDELVARLGPFRQELGQLFPQLADGGRHDPADPQAKLRLFEAFVALLDAITDETLLLVVEDVHWADSSTIELLDHVARRLGSLNALVVVTYRSDEMHRRHPLLPLLQAWRRQRLAETVKLEPLPAAGIAEMIAAIFDDDDVGDDFRDFMHARSEGNPFVLEEMLKEALDRGDIFRTAGGWDRKALDELRIPDTVRDAILFRLERLDRAHVTVLQVAAVLGRTFDHATLLAVALPDTDESAVHAALEVAVAEQLVEEREDGGYRWRHALTQEAIYTDTIAPRRQAIHSRAADVLAARPAARPVELASHLLGAGRFVEAVPACLNAADEAEATGAFRDAVTVLERALPHARDRLDDARIVSRIGRAHWLDDSPAVAVTYLESAVAALEELGEPVEAAGSRLVLGRCLWEDSRPALATVEFERAREILEPAGPSAELALAYMRLAGARVFELEYADALPLAERAVDIATQADAELERIWSLSFVALGLIGTGRLDDGFAALDAAFEQARAAGHWMIAWNAAYNDLWMRTRLMQPELEQRLERLTGLPQVVGTMVGVATLSGGSDVQVARGQLARAREWAEEALAEHARSEKLAWRCRVQVALTCAELGLTELAQDALPELAERTEAQDVVYDVRAHVRVRLARGDAEGAAAVGKTVLELAPRLARYRETLAAGVEGLVAGGLLDEAQALVDAGRSVDTAAGAAYLDEAEGRLLLARGDAVRAVACLRRAVDAAAALDFRLVELRARTLLASALGRSGDAAVAEAELEHVAVATRELGARLIAAEAAAVAESLGIALPPLEPLEAADAAPRRVSLGERLVTSLFADVRDSTALTAGAAPAEVAERLAALYRFAKTQVVRHHGIVDKFAGDAVMATFNVSGARVDHCVEALQSALALCDKAPLLGLELGVGIAVGPAVLGRGADDSNLAVRGISTNLAARLQSAAAAGEILLSDEAHRRVEPWLAERGLVPVSEELELKGFDRPQVAYRIAAPVAASAA